MALRVQKAQLPAELRDSMIKQLGAVPEPVEVAYNNPRVALANQEFSAMASTWELVDTSLKTFAHMAVAAQVGCSWCLDVNYFLAQNRDLDLAKASQVPVWRESEVFTPLERDVLAYAEAMTDTPTTVTDDLYAQGRTVSWPYSARRRWSNDGVHRVANIGYRVNTAAGISRRATPKRARSRWPGARSPSGPAPRMTSADPSLRPTAACCSRSPTRCSGRRPTWRTWLQETWLRKAGADHGAGA